MFLSPTNALAPLHPELPEFSAPAVSPRLASADLAKITKLTKLKHARYAPVAAALGEIALRRLQPRSTGISRAVITTGEGLHHELATEFGEQLKRSGARSANPIMFPNTLPSSCAALLGALFKAHVCSLWVGGSQPFFETLQVAEMLLKTKAADEVFIFACELNSCSPNLALGFLASHKQRPGPCLEIIGLEPERPARQRAPKFGDLPWAAAVVVEAARCGSEQTHVVAASVDDEGLNIRMHKALNVPYVGTSER